MARKKSTHETLVPRYRIILGRDHRGNVRVSSYESGNDTKVMNETLSQFTIVEVHRPFRYQVPPIGPLGFIFDGMTGKNGKPWPPNMVLATAEHGLFGFQLVG